MTRPNRDEYATRSPRRPRRANLKNGGSTRLSIAPSAPGITVVTALELRINLVTTWTAETG